MKAAAKLEGREDDFDEYNSDLSCSIDSDERDFIDNISWDTSSSEGDIEYDDMIFNATQNDEEL